MVRKLHILVTAGTLTVGFIMAAPLSAEGSGGVSVAPNLDELESYLIRAQSANPQLKAFAQHYEAAMQRIPQASALPDPMFQVTHFVESVQTRTGPQENVFMFSQRMPWFGKSLPH